MTIPFLCVLIAFVLIMAPKIPLSVAMARAPGGYDNKTPRDQQQALAGWGKRALFAHQNAIEAFPPFAAAVVVAYLSTGGASQSATAQKWSTILAVTFVVARTIYPILYIADLATLRSTVWSIGYFSTIALFLLSFFV